MAVAFCHKSITIKCEIPSIEYSKQFQLRLPSKNDWKLNLESILKRISKKLNLPSNIKQQQLLLTINDTLLNEKDPTQFEQLLSKMPPPAIITITQMPTVNKYTIYDHDLIQIRVNIFYACFYHWI